MRISLLIFIATSIVLISCTKDQVPLESEYDNKLKDMVRSAAEDGTLDYYVLPDEDDLAAIPQDPLNPLTPEKVSLGKLMFYDTGLATESKFESGKLTYSCASCHLPTAGFRPGSSQGVADGGFDYGSNGEARKKRSEYEDADLDVQSARPLSLINVAYVTNTFWNGQFGGGGVNEGTEGVWDLRHDTELNHLGFQGIETQNMEGLETHRIGITKEILDEYGYTELFDAAFPDVPEEERYTVPTASLAFSAYIRTIFANQAPFQKWLKGDDSAMTLDEKRGGILFFQKAQCVNCHFRPNLGSLEFHALGVNDMYQIPSFNAFESDRRNLGRGGFTLKEEDNYKFKVPQIYNAADAPHFFHGASKTTVEQLIDYKIAAESENSKIPQELLSTKFSPLDLTDEERSQLITFVSSALRDPDLTRYQPESVPSGLCFPNNDMESRIDLGCN